MAGNIPDASATLSSANNEVRRDNNTPQVPTNAVPNVRNNKIIAMAKTVAYLLSMRVLLLLIGYIVCYFNWSLTLPIVGICTIVWFETKTLRKSERIKRKVQYASMKKDDILNILDEVPSWLTFPDRERAEWLNEIILQLWPSISSYIVKYCRNKIQTNIRKKYDSFRFEDVDFGEIPPKIDGVKVYNQKGCKDSIIVDFDIFYDGNCNISLSLSGAQLGRIRDFQMGVEVRVILKPLLMKVPIIGGMQLFFLNTPEIDFELEGVSGIPGFSYYVRQKIEEKIRKKIVFPNKLTKKFSKSIEAAELKSLEPEGVLRVHVFEAKDLEKKDMTGKSDPYVILHVGAQEHRTQVVKRDLNPQWDYYCEFIILDPVAQQLYFQMFDQDDLNEDDFMGSGVVEIHKVIVEGKQDQWFKLDHAKHGRIHLRFSWLCLSPETSHLEAASQEIKLLKIENINTALLTVYIDSAKDLQKVKSYKKPDPYVVLTVGKTQQKGRVKKHTTDPIWEQGFSLLVRNPDHDSLILTVIDKQTDTKMDQMVYPLCNLFKEIDLQISKEEFRLQNDPNSKIILSLQLRILVNKLFENEEESDSDSDSEVFQRNSLIRLSDRVRKSSNIEEIKVDRVNKSQDIEELIKAESVASKLMTRPSFRIKPESRGQIEISLNYSELRQKLVVTIHRITNIPLKQPTDIPDPYVKLKLISNGVHGTKYKTKVVVDSCDPIFEESFEYLLSMSDLPKNQLVLTTKTKKFFNSSIIGQLTIHLDIIKHHEHSVREWFDLGEEVYSD